MNHELKIKVNGQDQIVFLQAGFNLNIAPVKSIHKHNYTEIQIAYGGKAVINAGNKNYHIESGAAVIIPENTMHVFAEGDDGLLMTAFQITLPIEEIMIRNLPNDLVKTFFHEIEKSNESGDYRIISAYLTLLCSYIFIKNKLIPKRITDNTFIIREFFSTNYNKDVHISDLAEKLGVSERQTERIVIACTGNSFKNELMSVRTTIAKHLIGTTDMPLRKISEYVGYHSYAGFWKAMKKNLNNDIFF